MANAEDNTLYRDSASFRIGTNFPQSTSKPPAAIASPDHSIIAVYDGESGQQYTTSNTTEAADFNRTLDWISKSKQVGPDQEAFHQGPISIDLTAERTGTIGRVRSSPDEQGIEHEGAGPTNIQVEAVTLAADILRNTKISQDQTSASQYSKEQLNALKRSADTTSAVPATPGIRENADVRELRWTESHQPPPFPPPVIHNSISDMASVSDLEDKWDTSTPRIRENRTDDRFSSERLRNGWSKSGNHRKMSCASARYGREKKAESDSDEDESKSDKDESMPALLRRLRDLERENTSLKNGTYESESQNAPPPVPQHTWRVFHCIYDDVYLEPPQWKQGVKGPVLQAGDALPNVGFYLDQHPEYAFVYYYDYKTRPPADSSTIMSKDGVFRAAVPSQRTLKLVSEHIIAAVDVLEEEIPGFSDLFPEFNSEEEIPAPYHFLYYSIPLMKDVEPSLSPLENNLLRQLVDSVIASHGEEYVESKRRAKKGLVSKRLLKYLIKPGDILIRTEKSAPEAYVALSWAREVPHSKPEVPDPDEKRKYKHSNLTSAQGPKKKTYIWNVDAWCWNFTGTFEKSYLTISIRLTVGDEDDDVPIDSLNYYPLQYGTDDVRALLERRGTMFWRCRFKNFVSYQEDENGLNSLGERYMVDTETYKALHPDSSLSRMGPRMDTDSTTMAPETMAKDEPPDDFLVAPRTIIGYNLRMQRWVDLHVDRVSDVTWNKEAFESLVVDPKTKELVLALITNQLAAEKSTDLITGKGNGLTILLHGGPGTGKTFTAEGVAEIAEKPLFRVTCGAVGTKPEEVEKYLASVLNLGKIWDCVVLLDEADVFLEERGLADLQRNALVSVFLRVLEYNVGILILTSNRVGTFDEAFKSQSSMRRALDFDDVTDHIDELVKEDMNGRQIRNAITTARQLAQYNKKTFCYEHLKHVIEVSGQFEKYLKALREGFSDDQIKREGGLR